MKQEIKNRWTGKVQFVAEIEATEETPPPIRIGLGVKWGYKNKSNLIGANMTYADLTGSDLTRADLTGSNMMDADLTGSNMMDADLTDAWFNRLLNWKIVRGE